MEGETWCLHSYYSYSVKISQEYTAVCVCVCACVCVCVCVCVSVCHLLALLHIDICLALEFVKPVVGVLPSDLLVVLTLVPDVNGLHQTKPGSPSCSGLPSCTEERHPFMSLVDRWVTRAAPV